jgi:5-oxoprolinase (ATP-hydrolysing)
MPKPDSKRLDSGPGARPPAPANGWQFWIDRGGTFTDIVAQDPAGRLTVHKLLSESPQHYEDAVLAGIADMLGLARNGKIPVALIDVVRMGTTVATNALLERKGERLALVVNQGYRDLLYIGNQSRPALFDLAVQRTAALYETVIELPGRIDARGEEIEPIDAALSLAAFERAYASGLRACAIVLMHAWRFPEAERRLAELARRAGFTQVSTSHEASPFAGIVMRGNTAVVDAYLSPVLSRYTARIRAGLGDVPLYFMQSYGGLAQADSFHGKDAILSGPAGGIVGAARTAEAAGLKAVIGFDMGGTSTDVSLYAGEFERTAQLDVAGADIRVPAMAIHTVAAGGGSALWFDGARLRVGPQSAGAYPGPACYRHGGPLTVTDANLCVGKIQPQHFPAIFGPAGDLPLDTRAPSELFAAMADEVAAATGRRYSVEELAEGFLRIAVANMAAAVKHISVAKGRNPADFSLQCFGGAGGQHACLVARELGIRSVFIHPMAGVLSAYGMGLAEQMLIRERAIEKPLAAELLGSLEATTDELTQEAAIGLAAQGAGAAPKQMKRGIRVRYVGTETALAVPLGDTAAIATAFDALHRARFGFSTPERPLLVDSVFVELTAAGAKPQESPVAAAEGGPVPLGTTALFSGGRYHDAPIFRRQSLRYGHVVTGPAILTEPTGTIIVEPRWQARINELGHVIIDSQDTGTASTASTQLDPVTLELFNNILMNIAERSGAVLQNTSFSVNIRERLDFSCALFDGQGDLVANAPHVPVHLGAMSESVKAVLRSRGTGIRPGDVFATNNPARGGTHLPDVTVITPVFDAQGTTILFFAASRGHHADLGGITPGSTPPRSATLEEEGIVIDDFLLVSRGRFREEAFRALLASGRYPARNPDANIADIQAQIAANEASRAALQEIIQHHGWPVVRAYMGYVMANAEAAIRQVIARLPDGAFAYRMDDGSVVAVAVKIDREQRSAVIDFAGTSPQRRDNFNAPPAVTRSVVLYVLRCLVREEIPLNEGCLKPIEIRIPPGTFLSPDANAAVVAGNTEVSQAVCVALLGAFGVAASSQATMNNFLFGDGRYQYYETICGGAGAGNGFNGASAIQTHMTNTRITDPETLEMRFPVRLEQFAVRRGSGGAGRWHGGDGVSRKVLFLAPMSAMIVSSQRDVAPFGLAGGQDGKPGRQWIERAGGAVERLGGCAEAQMQPGDLFVIETPGGGGFGCDPVRDVSGGT